MTRFDSNTVLPFDSQIDW